MSHSLTNLLPEERRRALRRVYFLRLGTTILAAAALLVVSAGLLLVPTYVFLSSSAASKAAQLSSVNASLASTDGTMLATRLSALSQRAQTLAALGTTPDASAAIRAALLVARPGVTLSGFSYSPPSVKGPGTLSLIGTAVTRSALRSYQIALEGSPFASAADLPVSAYAKDANIAFSILITLAP